MSDAIRILLIDDNPDDRMLAIRELSKAFPVLQVEEVKDQAELEQALAAGAFDVAVTDYQLLWSDGLEVLRAIKGRYPGCPVVMFTNTGTQEIAVEAMKSGLDDYVIKSPAHFIRLPVAVHAALEQAQARKRVADLEGRTRQALGALLAMAEVLVSSDDSPSQHARERTAAIAQRLLELICSTLRCQRTSIVISNPETGHLQLLATTGLTPAEEENFQARLALLTLSDYIAPHLRARLESGQVVIDPPGESTAPGPSPSETMLLVAPIIIGGRLVGRVAIDEHISPNTYEPDEVALVGAVGKLVGLVLEREHLARERTEALARALALQETTHRMNEFLSIASHELRTPVTAIKTNLQLMLRRAEREDTSDPTTAVQQLQRQGELLQRTERQIGRLTRLLDDLLDLSRIRAGKLEMHSERVNLNALVADVVEGERQAHPERTITLHLVNPIPVTVIADADRIGQVLLNYLTNALKYSPPEQPIAVSMQVDGQTVRVAVRDEGPGIPPAEQARIWGVFYQTPGAKVRSGSGVGLGLGLHISKTIIERHQGQVGVESQPGDGSTFWFTLPIANDKGLAI